MPAISVSDPSIGPACLMSRALPEATAPASSMSLISAILARSASRWAIALPIGPAPRIAAKDIAVF